MKLSVTSVDAFEILVANVKFIGPNGEFQFITAPVEDRILLLSSIESS